MSQKHVALLSGINLRTLIRWEGGEGEPGASDLRALARTFGVGIDQLVGDLLPTEDRPRFPRPSELSGVMLDFWIAKVQEMPVEVTVDGPVMYEAGVGQSPIPNFSSDLALMEPLMRAKGMHLYSLPAGQAFDGEMRKADGWVARCAHEPIACWGATICEAAARAWLAAEVGAMILA